MVKKLLKYEFMALRRILIPMAIALPSLALLSSLTLFIPSGTGLGLEAMQSLLLMLFIIAIAGFSIAAYVMCIVRFQKSMFSKEGYFTLALPVTPMQLLWTKFISAFLTILITEVIAFLSIEIFSVIHGVNLIGAIISALFDIAQQAEMLGLLIYALFYLIIAGMGSLLFIYACIAAGQLVNKNRGWLSIGAYVLISQILSVVFSLIQLAIFSGTGVSSPYLSLTIYLVQSLLMGVGSVFFIRYILKNKVNLQA